MIPSTGRPRWYHMAVDCSDVGSNSSLSLSLFWFDLSTPAYDLSNKARRGWGNRVLVNRSVLRQETSRTACFQSSHPLVHMITVFTNILFSTLGACYKVDNIGRPTTGVAPKLDGCPRCWLRDLCGGYYFAGLHLALPHGRVSPSGSSSRLSGLSLARIRRSHRLLGLL